MVPGLPGLRHFGTLGASLGTEGRLLSLSAGGGDLARRKAKGIAFEFAFLPELGF